MRFRLRTLLIVLALGPIALTPAIKFAHRRYVARVEGLRQWQQFFPNIKPVQPLWWIFESTPTYELPSGDVAFGTIDGTTPTIVK
jgi:hypothetical protein